MSMKSYFQLHLVGNLALMAVMCLGFSFQGLGFSFQGLG
jgi:hypothetical protein